MEKSGHVAMAGCFHSCIHQIFIECLPHMVLWWYEDESAVYSALGCVDSYSLNCGCEGKGKWLLIGLMRTKLWSGLVVLGFLFRCLITSIKESLSDLFFFNAFSLVVVAHFSLLHFMFISWQTLSSKLHSIKFHRKPAPLSDCNPK